MVVPFLVELYDIQYFAALGAESYLPHSHVAHVPGGRFVFAKPAGEEPSKKVAQATHGPTYLLALMRMASTGGCRRVPAGNGRTNR